MHAEYAWVSSVLATGDATDVVRISGGSDHAEPEKSKDEELCVRDIILSEDTYYKNTVPQAVRSALEVFARDGDTRECGSRECATIYIYIYILRYRFRQTHIFQRDARISFYTACFYYY